MRLREIGTGLCWVLVVRAECLVVFLGAFGDQRQSRNASSRFSPELEESWFAVSYNNSGHFGPQIHRDSLIHLIYAYITTLK